METLEDRLAPATLSQVGAVLTIDLNNAAEVLQITALGSDQYTLTSTNVFVDGGLAPSTFSGFGGTTGTLTADVTVTQIDIIDSASGASVIFNDSGANAYAEIVNVTLNNSFTGDITFDGTSTFSAGLTASTTDGDISSTLTSSIILGVGQNLSLTATAGDIELLGSVLVPGTTTLTAGCGIVADNPLNDFQGNVIITQNGLDRATVLSDANAFSFGATTVNGDLTVNAGGTISQTAAIIFSSTQTLNLATTVGDINLNNTGNSFNLSVLNLSTDDPLGNITVITNSTANLVLGDITLGPDGTGTGLLTISTRGNIVQPAPSPSGPQLGIRTGGNVNLTIDTGTPLDILLANLPNNIAGVVTVFEINGGDIRDFALRNVNVAAQLPAGLPITTANDIRDYTLIFDNAGIAMTTLNVAEDIVLTAGGDITQTGPLDGVTGTFTVLGDFNILLTNPGNNFATGGNFVSLNSPDADATTTVSYVENGDVNLGNSTLGLGTFSVQSVTGDIGQAGGTRITQRPDAGGVTFTAGGNQIDVDNAGNIFTGVVTFIGAGLTDINYRTDDPLASVFPILPVGYNDNFSITYGAAPIVLPELSATTFLLNDLSAAAQGIFQSGPLVIAGQADFRTDNVGDGFSIELTNALNDFSDLRVRTDGPATVAITDLDGVNFAGGDSTVGFGWFIVTAGGSITQTGGDDIVQTAGGSPVADVVLLTSTGATGVINLNNGGNNFVGPVIAETTGTNDVTLHDTNTLLLGTMDLGGDFTATANNIVQFPASTLTIAGLTTFDGTLDADNVGNFFNGSVSVNGNGGALRDSTPLDMATSNANNLVAYSGGPITQSGALNIDNAFFDAGTFTITLPLANDFDTLSLISTSSAAADIGVEVVFVNDIDDIQLHQVLLGVGDLRIVAGGAFDQTANGYFRQSGTGDLTFDGVGAVILDGPDNIMLDDHLSLGAGAATDVTIFNKSDIGFEPGTNFTGDIVFNAQGVVTLPITPLTITLLDSTARETVVANNITINNGGGPDHFIIRGALTFTNPLGTTIDTSLTSAAPVSLVRIQGDVTTAGPLTFIMRAAGTLEYGFDPALDDHGEGMTWNQGIFNLTITNGTGGFVIGDGGHKTTFLIGGTAIIDMSSGNGSVVLNNHAIFQVGVDPLLAEIVTLSNGAGLLDFNAGSALLVGLGTTTNDKLVKLGTGDVTIATDITNTNPPTRLLGGGVTGVLPTNVLETIGGGEIVGLFDNTVNTQNIVGDFLMGTDIATPTYDCNFIAVDQGGTSEPSGSFSIFEPDGDKVTVSTAAGADLAYLVDEFDRLAIVTRSPGASTLTVTTIKNAGNGVSELGGIAINGSSGASVTISAASSNVTGDILVIGRLATLTVRDVSDGTILGGGTASGTTTITARVLSDVDIDLATVLNKLTAAEIRDVFGTTEPESLISAQSFGTINITGNAGAGILGDMHTNLVSRTTSTSVATLKKATIAGDLSESWDLRNNIGGGLVSTKVVSARSTTNWDLGLPDGPFVVNGGLFVGTPNTLSLGFVTDTDIHATGHIAAILVKSWNGLPGTDDEVQAGSIGSLKTTGDLPVGDVGSFEGVDLLLTGNKSGFAIKTVNILGELQDVDVEVRNGNINTITVGRSIFDTNIFLATSATSGKITSIKAGQWVSLVGPPDTLEAKSLATFTLVGNTVDQIFGDLVGVNVTLHGTAFATSATLGTFAASGLVNNSSFLVENGAVTKFTVARELQNTPISILGSGGKLGTITAARWISSDLTAKSITTLKVTGAPQTGPRSPALIGDMNESTVNTFVSGGTGKSIATFFVAGNLDFDTGGGQTDYIRATNGITSFTVKRTISDGFILANGIPTSSTLGRIDTITVGAWDNVDMAVTSVGKFTATSYLMSENDTNNFVPGDFANSTVTVRGGSTVGISTFTTQGDFEASTLVVPIGITTLTVGRNLFDSTVFAVNPLQPAKGRITTLSAKHIGDPTDTSISTFIRANTFGTLKTVKGSVADQVFLGLNGDVVFTSISATEAVSQLGISTLSIAGSLENSRVDVRHNIKTFTVSEDVLNTQVGAGLLSSGQITTANVGRWLSSDLITNNLGTFKVNGNTALATAGDVSDSLFALTGAIGGVAIGTFTAQGTISDSRFHVTAGNVTSFTAGKFLDSDLLVGVRLATTADLASATDPVWLGNFIISSFKTTQPFNASNIEDTASFRSSNVVAQRLGTINLAGIDDLTTTTPPTGTVSFGVGFRTAGGSAGTLIINGSTESDPFTQGFFIYTGLDG